MKIIKRKPEDLDRITIKSLVKKGNHPNAVNDLYNNFSNLYVQKHQDELVDLYTQNQFNQYLSRKNKVLERYASRYIDLFQIKYEMKD
jgi:hypothetical protein